MVIENKDDPVDGLVHRKIIHMDMDAFYANIEQRDFPEYRGKPLVVGGSPDGRGVVATASYEARKFGIRSAMPCRKALQLCPHVLFVFPRFDIYKKVSNTIREIFRRYTDLVEPLSLDEAYLDVTVDKLGIGSAIEIAERIRQTIRHELQLTASAGVSVNKFVAKVASDMNKPDGLTFIGPSKVESFMEALPVEKFFGVGKVTAAKMKDMRLYTGADLKKLTQAELVRHFGKQGRFFYQIVRGIDKRPVQPHRQTKSVSVEETFDHDLSSLEYMEGELENLAERLSARLQKHQLKGRTLTLKIRFDDFSIITRSRSFASPVDDPAATGHTAKELLGKALEPESRKVRLLGITFSNFAVLDARQKTSEQLELF